MMPGSSRPNAPNGTMSALAEVKSLRERLWDAGFRPVAIYNHDSRKTHSPGKAPKGEEWTERNRRDPPQDAIGEAEPDALNTGILCDALRAIDIDVDNLTMAAAVRGKALDRFGECPMRTRPGTGRCLLLYRAAEGQPSKRAISGTFGKVEVLGRGQQFVAFGTHPSGGVLSWMPDAPGDVSIDHVPTVTEEAIGAFLAEVAPIIAAKPEQRATDRAAVTSSKTGLRADSLQVVAALCTIPNDGPPDWESWNRIGMATWAATGGAAAGLAAFQAWSEQHPAYDATETERRWAHYSTSPPTQIGAGTLFHLARSPREVPPPPSEDVYGATPDGHPDSAPDHQSRETEQPAEPGKAKEPPRSAMWFSDDAWTEEEIPMRPWVVPGYLMRGSVTVLAGAGSAGKSMLLKLWGCAAVLGTDVNRFRAPRPLRVLSYNVEDDLHEERRRLSAALRQLGATPRDLAGKLRILGPTDVGTLIERDQFTGKIRMTEAMSEMERHIQEFQPDVVVLDPLVELHTSEENDNTGLRAVIAQLRTMATRHNVSVCLLHHTRKGTVTPGDPDAVRGAGAIVGAARVVFTICTMSEEEATDLGIAADARRNYFRVDGAKMNYAPVTEPEWFEKVAYNLDNGEVIAAAVPWKPPRKAMGDQDFAALVHAIATSNPPLSPRLSRDPRSFAEACRKIGLTDKAGQLSALATLQTDYGVTIADCERPRARGVGKGLRTSDGQPTEAPWIDCARK